MSAGADVAVVTGAAVGIGRATVEALTDAGFIVVAADREALEPPATGRVLPRVLDVTDPEAVIRAAVEVERELGRIDVLVNNAGVFEQTPALGIDEATMRRVLDTNLCGVLRCTSAFGAAMAHHGGGRIINVASISGIGGAALASVYAASKGGVIAATRSAARELAPRGISVNAVAPGYCDTPMLEDHRATIERFVVPRIPMRRVATAREVARVVLFLATAAPDYQTGSVITLDGGTTSG